MAGQSTPDDRIEWLDDAIGCDDACPLCGNEHDNRVFMRALHTREESWLDVARCGACASAWFPEIGGAVTEYPLPDDVDPQDFAPYLRHYLELAAGIDWKVALAERLPHGNFATMLEVGCNAGAFLDYGRLVWGSDVVGLEPSAYGLAGAAALELPILQDRMSDATTIRGRTFDFVCAIEVLEHVDDPQQFLREIRGLMAPGGIAMVTTPGAHSLTPSTFRGELLAALSPGAHRFIASRRRLQEMIDDVGFAWSHIEEFGMTQVAYLAERPVDLAPSEADGPVEGRRREYYERAVARSLGDERQRLADRINLYTVERALGDAGAAAEERHIETVLTAEFGIVLDDLDSLLDHQATARTLPIWGDRMPYNLPAYLFWRGHRDDLDEPHRTRLWEAAALLAALGLRCDPANLFLYVLVLRPAVHALAGRADAGRRRELLSVMDQIPEAADLSIPEPALSERVKSKLVAVKRRIAARA